LATSRDKLRAMKFPVAVRLSLSMPAQRSTPDAITQLPDKSQSIPSRASRPSAIAVRIQPRIRTPFIRPSPAALPMATPSP